MIIYQYIPDVTIPGLDVKEVAHDHQVQVSRHVTEELGFLNSYDTWHGELKVKLFTNAYYPS